jgi:hypothetical protein
MRVMKLSVECYAGHKADERPVRFWLDEKQYHVDAVLDQWYGQDGTCSKFEPTTVISISFDNRHRALMAPGILFHFAKKIRDR